MIYFIVINIQWNKVYPAKIIHTNTDQTYEMDLDENAMKTKL